MPVPAGGLLRLLAVALLVHECRPRQVPWEVPRDVQRERREIPVTGAGQPCNHDQDGVMVAGSCGLDCPFIRWELMAGRSLQTAGCQEGDGEALFPRVCCPHRLRDEYFGSNDCVRWLFNEEQRHEQRANSSLAQRKCREYASVVCNTNSLTFPVQDDDVNDLCVDAFHELVWHGTDAQPGLFPHMALLGYDDPLHTCSGSLVSDRHILTAAHCTTNKNAGPVRWVRLGGVTRDDPNAEVFGIEEVILHPKFQPTRGLYDDLAVLRLNKTVELRAEVRPACLHSHDDEDLDQLVGVNATVAGWGRTQDGKVSDKLQFVWLPLMRQSECERKYNGTLPPALKHGIYGTQLCAGGIDDTDVDRGDSGGPIMLKSRDPYCVFRIVGITSSGAKQPGLGAPSVFSRVASYVPWLEAILWTEN